jgi:small-conductance mechanosensitive channel
MNVGSTDFMGRTWDSFLHQLHLWFTQHGATIITIIVVAWLIHRFGARFLSRVFQHTVRPDLYPTKTDREKRLQTLDSLISGILRFGIYIVAGLMIIGELGVNTGPLVASAGILGIALGFGAQSLIKDFVSGMFIIVDNQYRVGDIVKLGLIEGRVEAITIRTTIVRSLDGNLHHIPNGSIAVTTNKTMSFGGIDENIIVDIDTDVDRLIHIINHVGEELAAHPDFVHKIKQAPHFDRIVSFQPTGLEVKILGTTTASNSWRVKGELYKRLLAAFKKAHIEVPAMHVAAPPAKPAAEKA